MHRFRLACFLVALVTAAVAQPPTSLVARGVGGGGALYAPSLNPANPDEFYVACDMSDVFHSANFAAAYDVVPFSQLVGGHASRVCFTSDPATRYCISYGNWEVAPVKTLDGGVTWSPLPGNPDATEETFFIGADCNRTDRVVIAYYDTVYFTGNGGTTFQRVHGARNSGAGVTVGGAFFAGDSIFVGTSDGLLVSVNGGSNFTMSTATGIPAGQRILALAGGRSGGTTRLFCITADSSSIYPGQQGDDFWGLAKGIYSLDYGTPSWVSRLGNLALSGTFPMFIGMGSGNITTVYLGGSDSTQQANVMKTIDGGAAWSPMLHLAGNQNIATGWCGYQGDINWGWSGSLFGFAVCPTDVNRLLFTDWGFITKSSDGGATWQQAYTSPSDQNPAGSPTPTGRSYHSVGLENTSCWQVFWVDSLHMFAPFTDIKGVRSVDGGQSWSFDYTGHTLNTMYWMVKHPQTGTLYAATSSIHDMYESTRLQDATIDAAAAAGKVLYSTDGGHTWQTLHDFGKPVYWVALDPTNVNRLYASVVNYAQGVGGVYVTDNLASGASATWAKMPDPPRTQRHPAVIAVLHDGTIVCTYSGRRDSTGAFTASSGVFTATRSSGAWTDVSDVNMHYWTRDIVIDAFDTTQNTWYACVYSGWGGPPNNLGGLYRTTDRGAHWSRLNSLLAVPSCAINPRNRDEALVTTESQGLWYTNNLTNAAPAFSLVDAYPFSHPQRVFYNPYRQTEVWVASFGNGMRMGTMGGAGVLEHPGRRSPATSPRAGVNARQMYDLRGSRVGASCAGRRAPGIYCVKIGSRVEISLLAR